MAVRIRQNTKEVKRRKAFLLDVRYKEINNKNYIELLVKGKVRAKLLYPFDPYFLLDPSPYPPERVAEEIKKLKFHHNEKEIRIKNAQIVEKRFRGKIRKFVKVICFKPSHVPLLAKSLPFKCYEFKIPFVLRFLIDTGIAGSSVIKYKRIGRRIIEISSVEDGLCPFSCLAFDIEVYNPLGAPRERIDPILMISKAMPDEEKVFLWKGCSLPNICCYPSEKVMLEGFFRNIKNKNPDFLIGYNSSLFDIPYLLERAKRLQIEAERIKGRKVRKGDRVAMKLPFFVHIDLYPLVRFFGTLGMFNVRSYTLKHIYHDIAGEEALAIDRFHIWKEWDSGKVDRLVKYCLSDAKSTLFLFNTFFPLMVELSQLSHLPIFEITYATTGNLVEMLLMRKCFERNEVIPPKPDQSIAAQRRANPVEGAFVKLPEPGIYDNLVVFDFRSLYPSIIITYNVDPNTICKEDEDAYISPVGVKFKKTPAGLIPSTLKTLIALRSELKKRVKEMEKKKREWSENEHALYEKLKARVQALKILANSFFGYMAYANSRWYSRECAASVTAWGRQHIKSAAAFAEKKGFKVLYIDTDSLFLLLNGKSKEDALKLLEEINRQLPGEMELELEAFYKRALFVSKKANEKGAKKKYALLREDGEVKIRGFELVRRDWSNIARETQRKVLEVILKEGSKEKAVEIVKDVVKRLRDGKVDLKELIIYTQLKKKPESYEVKSPELVAALKARKRGIPVDRGSVVPYIITKKGGNISEKAEYADFATDYDPEYYIDHQVLPAVLKILKELGYG